MVRRGFIYYSRMVDNYHNKCIDYAFCGSMEQCSIYFAVVIAYFIVMTILNIAMRCMRSRKRSIVAVIVNVIAILLFIGAIHTHFEDKANIEFHEDNVKQIEIKITTR